MPPGVNITTTTNQYLAPAWVDQVLRDNFFFGQVLGNTKKWDGSQMLFPKHTEFENLVESVKVVSPYFTNMRILMGN